MPRSAMLLDLFRVSKQHVRLTLETLTFSYWSAGLKLGWARFLPVKFTAVYILLIVVLVVGFSIWHWGKTQALAPTQLSSEVLTSNKGALLENKTTVRLVIAFIKLLFDSLDLLTEASHLADSQF